MRYCFFLAFFAVLSSQALMAQPVVTVERASFYNFKIIKTNGAFEPYSVSLESINTVSGSFKPVKLEELHLDAQNFLVTVYQKSTGKLIYETVIKNPVDVDVEFDGADHHQAENGESSHNHTTLQRKVLQHPEGHFSLRLPYDQGECIINVGYIQSSDRLIHLATF